MNVELIVDAETVRLSERSTTWLADELRSRYPSRHGRAAGRELADKLELALVGERAPIVTVDETRPKTPITCSAPTTS